MKIKVKHVLLFIIVSITIMSFTIYNIVINNDVYEEVDSRNIINNKLISLMIEETRGSGVYKVSKDNKWPSKKYIFNETLSNCKNGSTLTWNKNDNSVTVNVNKTDKCEVYFDVEPADITIKPLNLPTTYGKLGSINCTNSDATYNQKYNRIEVSNINTKYENCTLNYTDSTSKVNLADYIIGLAGTTQGTGEVVSETANIPDYSSAVAISQSSYTSQSVFNSSSYSSTSGTTVSGKYTFANNIWTSVPSSMTSGIYYNFKFNPKENGYYQMCYNLSSGNANNRLYVYLNTIEQYFDSSSYLSASTTTAKSGCIELGYVSTSDYIKITQLAYTNISTLSFSIKKVAVVNSLATDTRYEGKNPNNYIWFNNEYWRIIGVFDSASHGVNGKNLVKIIRDDVLDGIVWHKSNINDWTAESLNLLLNGAYYNAQDGTGSGYCYGYSTTVTGNCDYTKRGIQSDYRDMIANVTWYLGGYSTRNATAEEFYEYERGTTVTSGRPTSTTGYIGLVYPSDYGYSVLSSSCARTTNLGSYNTATSCAGQSWLSGKGEEWTITPNSSDSRYVFTLTIFGNVSSYGLASLGYGSRPVLYLDASVYKIDGDGSLENPYIVGM